MALEDIEKKLYKEPSKEQKIPSLNKTESGKNSFKTGWSGEAPEIKNETPGFFAKFRKTSRWIFWILTVGILGVLAFAGFYFYQYFNAKDIVSFLKAPSGVMIGIPFDLEVGIQNNYTHPINDVKLSMIMPEGTDLIGESLDKRAFNKDFGNLDSNGNFQEKIPVIISGDEQVLKKFEITISYVSPNVGSGTRFEQTKSVNVAVQQPAVELDVAAPQKVLNGENFEIEVRYKNISDNDFSGAGLQLDYPGIFTFKSATVNPSTGNNVWKIGDLAKGKEGNFIVTGSVRGAENSFFDIKGSLKIVLSGQNYLINEKSANVSISTSPLSLRVALNDQSGSPVFSDSDLRYKIIYHNNSDVGLNDAVITAKLTGEMFDFPTLRSQGFFDSKNNTITWNVANTPELRVIGAGAESSVEFEIQTKDAYPIKRVSDKNFVLKIDAEISSPTVPYYVASEKTVGLASLQTKVAGKINISGQVLFNEPDAFFINRGVFPPKVNSATNFTVHWIITNYATDVKNIEVKAYLQSGVRWTGQFKNNNVNATTTYNDRTQEVSWMIDRIPATKGIVGNPAELIFQIEATPNITQAGQPMPLLGQVNLTAVDDFTNVKLTGLINPLTTVSQVAP